MRRFRDWDRVRPAHFDQDLPSSHPSSAGSERPRPALVISLLFGVVLPFITLIVEGFTHMCAATFFDPMPTLGHAFLLAMVPLVNLLCIRQMRKRHAGPFWLGWANGGLRAIGNEPILLRADRRIETAVALAALYQLVTPVSGAVVLETRQQYQEAGLTPVDPATVPAIPEPQTWQVLALGLALLMGRAKLARPR
jgi:hypothetical protein